MVKYKALTTIYIKQFYKYPIPLFIKLIYVPVEAFIYIFLWNYLGKSSSVDINYMIIYYILIGLIKSAYPFRHISINIQRDVMEGSISNVLVRPYPYILPEIERYTAWIFLYSFIFIPAIIFVIIVRNVSVYYAILFVLSFAIGNMIQFLVWYNVGLIALKIERIRGVLLGVSALMSFTSGSLVPLFLLPQWMEQVTYLFPFRYYMYFPLQTMLGEISMSDYMVSLALSFVWCVILWGLSAVQLRSGMSKLQANCA